MDCFKRVAAVLGRASRLVRRVVGQPRVWVSLVALVLLAGGFLAVTFSGVAVAFESGASGFPLALSDFSEVPESVVEDAVAMATELYGDCGERRDFFVQQLLGMYTSSRDKDFILLFSPGGWGWNSAENSPSWQSIAAGISTELTKSGYTSLVLDYQRTANTLQGHLNEMLEMVTGYSKKARELACRVEFLTSHNPEVNVILTGESNGSIICDDTMCILKDNPRVYSIQTGPPFWHKPVTLERTLVLTSNGKMPDSFSQGDIPRMIAASLKSILGLSGENEEGRILNHVAAPGHDYRWSYPAVCSEIIRFLNENFGTRWSVP